MKSESWKDVAELVGIGAIVASLVLLAYEIRQTRIAIVGETYLSRAELSSNSMLAIALSDDIPEVLQKYDEGGLESLTIVERARFNRVAHATKTRLDAYYYQYEIGLLDDDWYIYRFVPSVRRWRDKWQEIGALSEEVTRPTFLDAIEAVPD